MPDAPDAPDAFAALTASVIALAAAPAAPDDAPEDAPEDLTLDHVLEDLLPRLEDDVFNVAVWLEDHFRGKVRLLGDGQPIHSNMFPSYLGVLGTIGPDGRPRLEIQIRRAIGEPVKVELFPPNSFVVLAEYVGAALGYYGYGYKPVGPFKRWSVERKSYETYRPDLPSRSKSERKRDEFVAKAVAYIVANGLPEPQTAEALHLVLEEKLGRGQWPSRTIAIEILAPIVRAVIAELEQVTDAERKLKSLNPNTPKP
jgi:hypothetical protein